jgi:predicted nucleic acid-binding protein
VTVDVVVDNSALIEFVTSTVPDRALYRRLAAARGAAPELIDAEALNALRRLARLKLLTDEQALEKLLWLQEAPIVRVPHRTLLPRAWELRHAISAYDALYVALAELLDVPLITCDAKLGGANGHQARVEVYPAS